jgi:hypothetical protein
MQTRIVHDSKGQWLVNLAKFPFVDPDSGCRFDPHVPTQAKVTAWVKSQEAVIRPWVDPAEAEKAASLEAETKKLADEAAKAEADKLAAEKAAADAAKKAK